MFVMDFKSKGIAWIGKIGEKLENLYSEVDAKSQEQLDYVERQLQIAGTNLKQFYAEFIQEIFPEPLSDAKEEETSNLSSEQNRNKQLLASELSNISIEEDNEGKHSHSSLSSLVFPVETAEGVHIDSSPQSQADMVMKISVEYNLEKPLSSGKSSEVVASAEGNLSMTSLPCEGVKGVEGPAKFLTIESAECQEFDLDPSMLVGKAIDSTALEADISNVPSLTCSTYSIESQDRVLPFDEIDSCAALPAISDGVFVDHHLNEPGIDSVPEMEFDGNCVLVDRNDLSSGSDVRGTSISHKKIMPRLKVNPKKQGNKDATICEDLNVESEQSNAESRLQSSPNEKMELSLEVFCESDWEII